MPGILRTAGAIGSPILSDSFSRGTSGVNNPALESLPQASGGQWSRGAGKFFIQGDSAIYPANASGVFTAGATAFYAIGSGALYRDVRAEVDVRSTISTASGGEFNLYAKAIASGPDITKGVWARFVPGPSAAISLSILSYDGAATSILASVGLGGSAASGVNVGNTYTLSMQTAGATAQAHLAAPNNSGPPLLTAAGGRVSDDGHPALRARMGGLSIGDFTLDEFRYRSVVASAPDTDAREWFRVESDPAERVIQSNASIYRYDRQAAFRGQSARVVPNGSPMATGPAQLVVLTGEVDNFAGNDIFDVRLDVRERFTYLR